MDQCVLIMVNHHRLHTLAFEHVHFNNGALLFSSSGIASLPIVARSPLGAVRLPIDHVFGTIAPIGLHRKYQSACKVWRQPPNRNPKHRARISVRAAQSTTNEGPLPMKVCPTGRPHVTLLVQEKKLTKALLRQVQQCAKA